jgi:ubiquitin-protein ligase
MTSMKRLQKEYKQYINDPNPFYSININETNILHWEFAIFGPSDTIYEGGIFNGNIIFSKDYPINPPKVKFTSEILHPNIYKDGNVCISILHEGVDQYNYELESERWSPSHGVNSVMMSIISMLNNPNTESPANVDASKLFNENYEEYKKKVYSLIANS